MTAKKKGGKLARVAALEEARAMQMEEVKEANWAHIEAAAAQLSPGDRASLQDLGLLGGDGLAEEELNRVAAVLEGLGLTEPPEYQHPAKAEADAWANAVFDVPEGAPLLVPPANRVPDFVSCFEVEALAYLEQARAFPSSPEVQRVAGWAVALARLMGKLAEVLAGTV